MNFSRYYVLPILIVVSLAACKATQNQEASVSKTEQMKLTKPIKLNLDGIKLDTSMSKAAEPESAIDTLYLTIRRTPCYGKCPIYQADIYNSGYVVYNGKRFVKNEGLWTGRLTPDALQSIRHMARTVKYFDFEDEYDSPVTDFPSTYTTMHFNGLRKTIKNRVGGPAELKEFENHVQKVLDGVTWTKKGGAEE